MAVYADANVVSPTRKPHPRPPHLKTIVGLAHYWWCVAQRGGDSAVYTAVVGEENGAAIILVHSGIPGVPHMVLETTD